MDVLYRPNSDAQWRSWGHNFSTRLLASPETYGVDEAAAAVVSDAFKAFDAVMKQLDDPRHQNPPTYARKRDLLHAFDLAVRPVVGAIKANVEVDDGLRADLRIKPRRTGGGTPARVPGRPEVMALLSGSWSVHVIVSDPSNPGRRGRPAGVRQVAYHVFLGENPPADPAQWPVADVTGTMRHDLIWPGIAPTRAHVSARLLNTRNEKGPMSIPVEVFVPGTGDVSEPAETDDDAKRMKIAA